MDYELPVKELIAQTLSPWAHTSLLFIRMAILRPDRTSYNMNLPGFRAQAPISLRLVSVHLQHACILQRG